MLDGRLLYRRLSFGEVGEKSNMLISNVKLLDFRYLVIYLVYPIY